MPSLSQSDSWSDLTKRLESLHQNNAFYDEAHLHLTGAQDLYWNAMRQFCFMPGVNSVYAVIAPPMPGSRLFYYYLARSWAKDRASSYDIDVLLWSQASRAFPGFGETAEHDRQQQAVRLTELLDARIRAVRQPDMAGNFSQRVEMHKSSVNMTLMAASPDLPVESAGASQQVEVAPSVSRSKYGGEPPSENFLDRLMNRLFGDR